MSWLKTAAWTGVLAIACSAAFAQEQNAPPRPEGNQADGEARGREVPEMREMARAMKSMADMCQMMLRREMAARPYWVAAIIAVGSLLVVALVLFVILEVQWIRYWNLRIKTERKSLS